MEIEFRCFETGRHHPFAIMATRELRGIEALMVAPHRREIKTDRAFALGKRSDLIDCPPKSKLPLVRALHLPEAYEIDFVAPARFTKCLPRKIVWRLKKDHQHSSAIPAGFSRPAGK